jgi:aminoglycoside 6'-N-acetyltransferase
MLQRDRLQLRPLARGDLKRLDLINREPAVARWWRPGIDLFLTSRRHGHGLGAEATTVLARHLINDRGHHRLVIDPAAANATAIRSYARVGFRPVGVMRRYQIDPASGDWADSLLMDLLAEELEVG